MLKRELAIAEKEQQDRESQSSQSGDLKSKLAGIEADTQAARTAVQDADKNLKARQLEYDERRKKLAVLQASTDPVAINKQIKVVENRLEKVGAIMITDRVYGLVCSCIHTYIHT